MADRRFLIVDFTPFMLNSVLLRLFREKLGNIDLAIVIPEEDNLSWALGNLNWMLPSLPEGLFLEVSSLRHRPDEINSAKFYQRRTLHRTF